MISTNAPVKLVKNSIEINPTGFGIYAFYVILKVEKSDEQASQNFILNVTNEDPYFEDDLVSSIDITVTLDEEGELKEDPKFTF